MVFQGECACRERRIQDEAEPWRARKWKPTSDKSLPSVVPLPMNPGYASNWMHIAVRAADAYWHS